MKTRIKRILVFWAIAGLVFCAGCGGYDTIASVLLDPTSNEKRIPAEYDISGQKILVLVEQPAWLRARVNLRYYITWQINAVLEKKAGIKDEFLIDYEEVSKYRSGVSGQGGSLTSVQPVEMARGLGADVVLVVTVEEFSLIQLAAKNYYKGALSARAGLFDAGSGKKLWPESQESKLIRVGFEVEDKGREAAIERLAFAGAYCTARYLYDCLENRFKIFEDKSGIAWRNW